MQTDNLILIGLLVMAGILFMKFVYWTVGRDLAEFSRYQQDAGYRQEKISRLSEVIENSQNKASELLLRGQLWRMNGDNSKALQDLQSYLTIKNKDSEGWAELCECALALGDKNIARDAAEKAVNLDSEYGDYRALRLRAALLEGDVVMARQQLAEWQEIDRRRLAAGNKRKSIFKSDDRHFGELVADPAVTAYEAAVVNAEGDNEHAGKLVRFMHAEHASLWRVMQENDPLLAELK